MREADGKCLAVPELLNISNIYGVQVANVDSSLINSTILLDLARQANAILCSEGSPIDSVLITHGTDTLEETAFFMDATVNCGKPVVIVGAMRPATAISADGPANLYQAVQAGIFPESRNRGALIILNDRIGAAYYTQKTHSTSTASRWPSLPRLGGRADNTLQSTTSIPSKHPNQDISVASSTTNLSTTTNLPSHTVSAHPLRHRRAGADLCLLQSSTNLTSRRSTSCPESISCTATKRPTRASSTMPRILRTLRALSLPRQRVAMAWTRSWLEQPA